MRFLVSASAIALVCAMSADASAQGRGGGCNRGGGSTGGARRSGWLGGHRSRVVLRIFVVAVPHGHHAIADAASWPRCSASKCTLHRCRRTHSGNKPTKPRRRQRRRRKSPAARRGAKRSWPVERVRPAARAWLATTPRFLRSRDRSRQGIVKTKHFAIQSTAKRTTATDSPIEIGRRVSFRHGY